MDDRFDFILISNNIKNGSQHVKYVNGSYWAVGQDGKHFNKGLLDAPTNNSVPGSVLNALGKNSDHLPVTLKLSIDQAVGIDEYQNSQFADVGFINPVNRNLRLNITTFKSGKAVLSVFDFSGKKMIQQIITFNSGKTIKAIDVSSLKRGLYIIRITDKNGISISRKMMKW
jgi:hypothetical protein